MVNPDQLDLWEIWMMRRRDNLDASANSLTVSGRVEDFEPWRARSLQSFGGNRSRIWSRESFASIQMIGALGTSGTTSESSFVSFDGFGDGFATICSVVSSAPHTELFASSHITLTCLAGLRCHSSSHPAQTTRSLRECMRPLLTS